MRKQQGFTLVEVTIILLVLVILSSIMLPQLGNFNRLARYVKVKEDLGAICATMKKFLDEVMVRGPFGQPGGGTAAPLVPIGLLYGPGAVPSDSVTGNGAAITGGTSGAWDTTGDFQEIPDVPTTAVALTFKVDNLINHLQVNRPLGTSAATATYYYKTALTAFGSAGAFFGWRGPYFDSITSDPWGNRYMVNSFGLHADGNGNTFSTAVVCFSAGPNGNAETRFNQPFNPAGTPATYGWTTGGDDEVAVLSAWGPF